MKTSLTHTSTLDVKFSEADPLGIVWHGHFIRYFEDAREAFGKVFGLRYLDLYRENIVVPIIHIECNYRRILRYGHSIQIETTYIDSPAAKLLFDYSITDLNTGEVVANGNSVQVFMERESLELLLTIPKYMAAWKEKWLAD